MYSCCVLSVTVEKCGNKGVNTICDGWLHYHFQIDDNRNFYSKKFENKFGVINTCLSCFNFIMYSLNNKDHDEIRTLHKNVDENSFDSMNIKEVDDDDSDSDFIIKSNIDIGDDNNNITSTDKSIVCRKESASLV